MYQQQFSTWLESAWGQQLLALEAQYLADIASSVTFDKPIFSGSINQLEILSKVKCNQPVVLNTCLPTEDHVNDICASAMALPLQAGSVHTIVLPHSLELVLHPWQILQEVSKVLRAEGRVLIVGFDPNSWWRLRRNFLKDEKKNPGQFHSAKQICNYLEAMGFEITQCQHHFYSGQSANIIEKPTAQTAWSRVYKKMTSLLGGIHVILAQKTVLSPVSQSSSRASLYPVTDGIAIETASRELLSSREKS